MASRMSGTLRGDVWRRRIRYSPSEMGAVLLNRAPQTHYRYVIAGLLLLCYFSGGLNFAVVTPLFKLIIAEYGITHAIVSLLVSLVSLINASVGLPGGIIGGRWEARRILLFSWLLIGLLALSPLAPNFWVLLALRLAYGVGFGLQFPATGPLLMAWFQPNETRVLSGLNIALFGLGVAISVTTVVPLADLVGWRSALGVFGGFALVGALVWAVFARSAPGEAPRYSGISTRDIWDTLRHKTLVLVILADVAVFSQYQAITSWLPAFYNEVRGMSLEQAGFVTGLLPLVGVAAVMAGGILTLRIRSRRFFLIVPGLLVGLGGLGVVLMESHAGIYVAVIMLGIGSWAFTPTLVTIPMELPGMTPHRLAVVWGALVTFSGIGMAISPIVVGGLKDLTGSFVPGLLIFAVLAWWLLLSGILLPKEDALEEPLPCS